MIDAALAAGMGSMLVALASPLRALAGAGLSADALRLVGLFLLPWAAHNWFTGRDVRGRLIHGLVQCAGDLLWIALSLALCVEHWAALSGIGRLLYASQTVVVALVLATKLRALVSVRPTAALASA